ncbi:CoA transferase [Mycolicibacter senuensis]|uniref:CoA transferase n=1 Tax=Mycolicibacter kumamotonensis TaxID=354243 RepID=A0A7K3L8K7_9MYCO|nr:CoA transferase [Mycolicibacter kumamotonensis]NDJ87956.1 CoA transferase [Mycolicibacter kumamotonensis]RAV03985.1 CoA transferase [Mycolicibacter senuensis]
MAGITVVEAAAWTFVPSAGAVLADWGADVIKIEHPETGDPQRGLISSGLVTGDVGGANYLIEQPNRGKRSVGIDLASTEGRAALDRLLESADVFVTSFLPRVREKLGVDPQTIRARHPHLVYALGSGQGTRGDEASKGGYDGSSYFARSGIADALTPHDSPHLVDQPSGFGDLMGGLTLAGGISAALLARERGRQPPVVDVSLLGLGLWNLGFPVVAAKLYEGKAIPAHDPDNLPNPIARAYYRTADNRHLTLIMLESDRFWPDLCEHLERPDLIVDPRFHDAQARRTNNRECIAVLREVFAGRTLDDWSQRLRTLKGVWSPVRTALETHADPQVLANGYLPTIVTAEGVELAVVANPVRFDETAANPRGAAPAHGQHTEEVLLGVGFDWDDLARLKEGGAIT